MSQPFKQLTDDDIRQMAREAEAENDRLQPTQRRPRGWHYRRASIRLNLIPLTELSVEEVAWQLQEAMARVKA
jgi:hypothetical protein